MLRDAGLRLVTMDERYGRRPAELVPDSTWIREATREGRVLVGKDEQIRTNAFERRTVEEEGARYFVLTRQNLPAPTMAAWLLANVGRMRAVCVSEPGPFIYAVYADRVRRVL
jgi:hypothetical protein